MWTNALLFFPLFTFNGLHKANGSINKDYDKNVCVCVVCGDSIYPIKAKLVPNSGDKTGRTPRLANIITLFIRPLVATWAQDTRRHNIFLLYCRDHYTDMAYLLYNKVQWKNYLPEICRLNDPRSQTVWLRGKNTLKGYVDRWSLVKDLDTDSREEGGRKSEIPITFGPIHAAFLSHTLQFPFPLLFK